MRLNSRIFGVILLSGGLLLVLAQGLGRTPEIRLWLFPDSILEEKLHLAQKECTKIAGKLAVASASVDALYKLSGTEEAYIAPPQPSRLSLTWFKEIFIPDFLSDSFERKWIKQLYQARTTLVMTERKLTYLDAFLESLASSAPRVAVADKATVCINPNLDIFQQRINSIKQRCRGYRKELDGLTNEMKSVEKEVSSGRP